MSGEVMSGLKIAMKRGSSLEAAVRSFINAGYNPAEVEAAGRMLSSHGGAVSTAENREMGPTPQTSGLPPLPSMERRKKKSWMIALIIFAIVVLLGAISYLVYALYK